MTANLQPALHRAHVTLNKCNPQAVVLDRDGVAWQKWYRRCGPPDTQTSTKTGSASTNLPSAAPSKSSMKE